MMSFLSRVLPILAIGGYMVYGNVHGSTVRLQPSMVKNVTVPHGSDVTVTFSIPNITDMAYIRVFTPNPKWRNHSLYVLSGGHPHNFTTACDWLDETLYCNLTVIDVQAEDEGEYRIENDICHEHPLTNHCTPSEVRKFRINAFVAPPVTQTTQSTQTDNHMHNGTYIGEHGTENLGAAAGIIGGTCAFLAALWIAAMFSVRGSLNKKEVEYKSVEDVAELDAMLEKELEVEDKEKERAKTPPPEGKSIKVGLKICTYIMHW
ncbi:uncharacterized protein LOC144880432 [Branchiostoma floridae x Branchiostoma japonicum]